MSSQKHVERARSLLRRVPLIDGHNDLPWAMRRLNGYDLTAYDVGERQARTHTDLQRLREGGVGAQFWSVYVPSSLPENEAVTATLEQIDFVYELIQRYPSQLAAATSADDVLAVFEGGKIASLLGAEGGHSIAGSLGVLRQLYALGVRYLTLTHNDTIAWADSATDAPRSGGLSAFGCEVVREMNRLGMLVDLAHVSIDTMNVALDVSAAPVIFSHSCCRELADHPRNVPDALLLRLRDNGGVCMISFVPEFVSAEAAAWSGRMRDAMTQRGLSPKNVASRKEFMAEFAKTEPRPRATLAQVADHIEHARDVAGIDHVGIGGDFDGSDELPEGLEDVSTYPYLFAELIDRGWTDSDCAQVAGGNLLRVLREAEAVSAQLRRERMPSRATLAV